MAARPPLFVARAAVLTLAVAALAMTLLAGPATRMEIWPWPVGIALMRYGAYVGIAAALGALILLGMMALPRWRSLPWVPVVALAIAVAAVAPPLMMVSKAKSLPLIHDVSTDLADPPKFVALADARRRSPNGVEHGGEKVADLQRKGYPDVKPMLLKSPPKEAMQRALDAARSLGWEIASADAAAGRIEATATTAWWGFRDDIVVRVRPEGAGARIDVRSASRVGLSDLGANAERIRSFLARLT
jgi:uncharacterized protein (DUF1499 family)